MGLHSGLRWAALASSAPALADRIRGLVEQYRFALIATLRKDGSPRISAVEIHIVGDDLIVVMLPRTHKARDIARDNRVTLQSPVVDAAEPGAEYKLRARLVTVEDDAHRSAAADVVEGTSGWRPPPTWLFLALEITHAAHLLWKPDGAAELMRWSVDRPDVKTRYLRLDTDFGGYRES